MSLAFCINCNKKFDESDSDASKNHKGHNCRKYSDKQTANHKPTPEQEIQQEQMIGALKAAVAAERKIESDPLQGYVDVLKEIELSPDAREGESKPKPGDVAEIMFRTNRYALIEDTRKLLKEENRVFNKNGEASVKKRLAIFFPDENSYFRSEVVKLIGDLGNEERSAFDKDKMILNCKNCFVNLENCNPVENTDGAIISLIQIPTDFRPELGESKLFVDALKLAAGSNWEMILEIAACSLSRGLINPEKALIMVGAGSNAKSVLLLALHRLLGKKNVSTIRLQDIPKNRFASSRMEFKLANISNELTSEEIKEFGTLKSIISQEDIPMESKFVDSWSTVLTCVLMFACNMLPTLPDFGIPIMKRLAVVPFTKTFEKNDAFRDSLSTPDERSKILNTLISYHQKIMKNNGKLFHVQEPEETEKIWKYHTNSSTQFIAKHILPDTGQNSIERDMLSKPTVDIVYSEYLRYCHLTESDPRAK